MNLLNLFRKKPQTEIANPDGKGVLPTMKLSQPREKKIWFTALLAIGQAMKEAEEKGEDINFREMYKRSIKKYSEIQKQQLPDGHTGTQQQIGSGKN